MPQFSRPSCYVRLNGVDYKTRRDGLEILYMPNGWQVAKAIIDLNETSPPAVNDFDGEDGVEVKIENVTMLSGYIVTPTRICEPLSEKHPGKRLALELLIADKIGYTAKTEFSNDYFRPKSIQRLIQDVAGTLGVSHSVSASLSNTFQRSFFGTMAKDALQFAVEKGADWFGTESEVLEAWPQSSPPSLTTGALTYQIQDFASGGSHQLEVSHLHPYRYTPDDALHRYRNVKVMNSNRETFPKDIHQITNTVFWNGTLGYNYARWIVAIEKNGEVNKFRPAKLEPGPPIGGGTNNDLAPATAFYTEHTGDKLMTTFLYVGGDDTAMTSSQFFKLPMGSYDQLWFHLFTNITLADASSIQLQLLDNTTAGSAFYRREIKGDLNGSDVWTFLLYQLPTDTSGPDGLISNGWTKVGAGDFNQIDTVFITYIRAASGTNTGWPVGTAIKYATFFFARRVSATASGAGGLNLTKPIVNDTTQLLSDLSDQASKELARVGYATKASCTVPGHTDFKRPGYQCNVNFNQTFGTGHSGTLRMEKIRHYLDDHGYYWMNLEFGPALQRL